MPKIEKKLYKSIDIAYWLVKKAKNTGFTDMTHLRIQKMTYIAHGWMLGLYDRRLIEEDVEAWLYGPVIPNLYNQLRFMKNANIIPRDLERYKCDTYFSAFMEDFLNKIYDVYSKPSGGALIEITHEKGTPWHTATGGKFFYKTILPMDIIKNHYKMKADENARKQKKHH